MCEGDSLIGWRVAITGIGGGCHVIRVEHSEDDQAETRGPVVS